MDNSKYFTFFGSTSSVRGETPLHLAARANQTDIVRILLRNGATVDARARVSFLSGFHVFVVVFLLYARSEYVNLRELDTIQVL